jgi:hypothetical protein
VTPAILLFVLFISLLLGSGVDASQLNSAT